MAKYEHSVSGSYAVYDAAIENFEQAVALVRLARQVQGQLDSVQTLGLWKASIIFSVMAVEARVRQALMQPTPPPQSPSSARTEIERLLAGPKPIKEVLNRGLLLLTGRVLKMSDAPWRRWLNFVDYRDKAV